MTESISALRSDLTNAEIMGLPGRKEPGVFLITLTPEIARAWLAAHKINRKLYVPRVKKYARAMLAGEWMETGESIKISDSNAIIDGQHRLEAVIESGVSIRVMVITGIPESAMFAMDTGKSRSYGDALTLVGLSPWEARAGGAAVSLLLAHEDLPAMWMGAVPNRFENSEVVAYWRAHPELLASVQYMRGLVTRHTVMPYGYAVSLHYLFSQQSREDADVFFDAMYRGVFASDVDPIYQLVKFLRDAMISKRRVRAAEYCVMTTRAWNMRRAGLDCTSIRQLKIKATDETLPEIE
jgi:hypothetical protein